MRPSKRTSILDAAVVVVERDGVTAVTFESVSAEAGVTKGGLLYHFPTREALLLALHTHVAQRWEASLVAAAGAPASELSARGRLATYARVSSTNGTRAELALMLEAADDPVALAVWDGVIERWAPAAPAAGPLPEEAVRALVAQLAADGLWLHRALGPATMSADVSAQVAEYLTGLVGEE